MKAEHCPKCGSPNLVGDTKVQKCKSCRLVFHVLDEEEFGIGFTETEVSKVKKGETQQ